MSTALSRRMPESFPERWIVYTEVLLGGDGEQPVVIDQSANRPSTSNRHPRNQQNVGRGWGHLHRR